MVKETKKINFKCATTREENCRRAATSAPKNFERASNVAAFLTHKISIPSVMLQLNDQWPLARGCKF